MHTSPADLTLTRRAFAHAASVAACAALAPAATAQPAPARVRRNVLTLPLTHPVMQAYIAGVRAMRARPPANPTSWRFQASVHRTACAHGNWFFLPWHRAYLIYFEEICRAASGYADFALPYWDWTVNRRVPGPFWDPASPLFDDTRRGRTNVEMPSEAVGADIVDPILTTPLTRTLFGAAPFAGSYRKGDQPGSMEFTPHNTVHGVVGGRAGNMNNPDLAALDPIFWLHHCNVDRLWTKALAPSPEEAAFQNQAFTFQRQNGGPVTVAVRDLLDHRRHGYRYDDEPEQRPVRPLVVARTLAPGTVFGAAPAAAAAAPGAFATAFQGAAKPATGAGVIQVTVEKLTPPDDPTIGVRVFLNTPDATVETSLDDPGYVGTITFFGAGLAAGEHDGQGHTAHAADYVLDATRAAARLQANGRYKPGDAFTLSLVPASLLADPRPVFGAPPPKAGGPMMAGVTAAGVKFSATAPAGGPKP